MRNAILARLHARAAEETWTTTYTKYQQTLREREADLRRALAERSLNEMEDLELAVRLYRKGCEARASMAKLEVELERARLLEVNRANRKKAQEDLLQAARDQGLEATDPESALKVLARWQEANRGRIDWQRLTRAELKSLLNGRPAKQLYDEAISARQKADILSIGLCANDLTLEVSAARPEQRISEAQDHERRIIEARALAEGALRAFQVPDLSSCEEAVTAARAELDRVQRLDLTLKKTREFLERAQDRVHREFAPHLENIVRKWLPRVTAARYIDAKIDPAMLTVQVQDVQGNWRNAEILSQGTREQIYLLLRVAVIRFLTKSSESSPVILDDVTTQSDSTRTDAILELLHEISREQQVIMFSQEDHVRRWSESHLSSSRDRLVSLETPLPVQSAATTLDITNAVHS
jgi:DNA repair protein SbcC/Rad50